MLVSIASTALCYLIVKFIHSRVYTPDSQAFHVKAADKLLQDMEYSSIIRVYLNAQLELSLAASLQLRLISLKNRFLLSSSLLALICSITLVFIPFELMRVLNNSMTCSLLSSDETFIRKFGSIFAEFNTQIVLKRNFASIYIIRRVFCGIFLVMFSDYPQLQCTSVLILNASVLLSVILFQPNKHQFKNVKDIITESILTACTAIVTSFSTDLYKDHPSSKLMM
jgi:signal peptidase I